MPQTMQNPIPDSHPAEPPAAEQRASRADPRAGAASGAPPEAPRRRATDAPTATAAAPHPDRALNLLLLAAERDVRVGMTVNAGGMVVTGTLIGTLAYCRALADQFASAAGGTDMDELFADAFRDLVDDATDVARGDRRSPPDAESYARSVPFLHLADARYVGGAGMLPLGRHGVLWRCRVAEITSWSIGDLTSP